MQGLEGIRVLLVEDDELVAMIIDDMVSDLGGSISGNPRSLVEAMERVEFDDFDIALLDINIAGQKSFPVAQVLQNQDKQFLFASGAGRAELPNAFRDAGIICKPLQLEALSAAISSGHGLGGLSK